MIVWTDEPSDEEPDMDEGGMCGMKEGYLVAYTETEEGLLCTSEEFGLEEFLIENKDKHLVYDILVDFLGNKMIFDKKSTYLLRAPYEEKDTDFELEDNQGVFVIRILTECLDVKIVEQNTQKWLRKQGSL